MTCPTCNGLKRITLAVGTIRCRDCAGTGKIHGFCNECGGTLRPSDGRETCEDCVDDFGGASLDTRPEDRREQARLRRLNLITLCNFRPLQVDELNPRIENAWRWQCAWDQAAQT